MTPPRALGVLHLLLAVAIPLLLTMMLGCLRATAKREDLGPEVPADTINKILGQALQTGDLNHMTPGQFVDFVSTRRFQTMDTDETLGSRRVEVLDRSDSTTQAHFTMRITNIQRQPDGTFRSIVSEDALHLNKTATTVATNAGPLPSGDLHSLDSSSAQRTSYHHLQESDSSLDVPTAVRARAGCGGLNPCTLPVHVVHFDMVLWQDAVNYQKVTLDFAFSTQTPYLPYGTGFEQLNGILVADCRATYIPVKSGKVYVRDCLTLDDFQK